MSTVTGKCFHDVNNNEEEKTYIVHILTQISFWLQKKSKEREAMSLRPSVCMCEVISLLSRAQEDSFKQAPYEVDFKG